MDAIITKILDIEKRAQDIVQDAEDKKINLDEDIDESSQELRQQILNNIYSSLEIDKEKYITKAKAQVAEIIEKYKLNMQTFDSYYNENKEKWLNTLYSRVIGR